MPEMMTSVKREIRQNGNIICWWKLERVRLGRPDTTRTLLADTTLQATRLYSP